MIFRIGHIGWYDVFDITTALAAVELVLGELGAEIERGRRGDARARGVRRGGDGLKVLVREPIAPAGVELLRERFDVDEDGDSPLEEIIGRYDAIVIRSATKLTADVIERAERLKVIGRAGVGIDNVDVEAATRRGIVVANAPDSTVVSAAEHTIGLLVALARNIPQAHAALKQGRWERSRWGGIELADKTLGVLGFGRIGQQVARRALGLGMHVVAYDPFVAPERFRELGVDARRDAGVRPRGRRLPHAAPAADRRDARLRRRGGAREDARRRPDRQRRPRRARRRGGAGRGDPLRQGRGRGARRLLAEPYEGQLLELENVVVTPHLAASTDEAQDRAGVIVAEQVVAALDGGLVTNAVNIPVIGAEDLEVLGPYIPLAAKLGRLAMELAGGASAPDRALLPRRDRRLRHAPAHGRGAERRLPGPGRAGGQLRQRARDRRGARDRGDRGALAAAARLHEPRHGRRWTTSRSRARRSARSRASSSPARSGSRSTSSSRRGWSSSATTTCRA